MICGLMEIVEHPPPRPAFSAAPLATPLPGRACVCPLPPSQTPAPSPVVAAAIVRSSWSPGTKCVSPCGHPGPTPVAGRTGQVQANGEAPGQRRAVSSLGAWTSSDGGTKAEGAGVQAAQGATRQEGEEEELGVRRKGRRGGGGGAGRPSPWVSSLSVPVPLGAPWPPSPTYPACYLPLRGERQPPHPQHLGVCRKFFENENYSFHIGQPPPILELRRLRVTESEVLAQVTHTVRQE